MKFFLLTFIISSSLLSLNLLADSKNVDHLNQTLQKSDSMAANSSGADPNEKSDLRPQDTLAAVFSDPIGKGWSEHATPSNEACCNLHTGSLNVKSSADFMNALMVEDPNNQ